MNPFFSSHRNGTSIFPRKIWTKTFSFSLPPPFNLPPSALTSSNLDQRKLEEEEEEMQEILFVVLEVGGGGGVPKNSIASLAYVIAKNCISTHFFENTCLQPTKYFILFIFLACGFLKFWHISFQKSWQLWFPTSGKQGRRRLIPLPLLLLKGTQNPISICRLFLLLLHTRVPVQGVPTKTDNLVQSHCLYALLRIDWSRSVVVVVFLVHTVRIHPSLRSLNWPQEMSMCCVSTSSFQLFF